MELLLCDERIGDIAASFDPATTHPPSFYGELLAPPRDAGTQHISVADGQGGAVALTTTINTSFGSGLVEPTYGIVLNNEMDDFAAAPGVPNAFGLVGGEANAVAPGKRPLSSMTPTVVLGEDGRPALVVGASGGSFIISSTLQVLLDVLVFGMAPDEALAQQRIHHQWLPNLVFVEPHTPSERLASLAALGHDTKVIQPCSAVQVLQYDAEAALWGGASDPRKGGKPAGRPVP